MHRIILVAIAWLPAAAAAQDPPKPDPKKQEPDKTVVITASPLNPDDVFDAPYSIDVTPRSSIDERQARTLPEALKEMPGVSVQKTSSGHGSPFIRGFTGFRNIFLIDGVRLNHAAFRDGPNQYWNTVDSFTIDRLELMRGPASVLYGSDAIGGTVYVHTRTLEKFPDATEVGGRAVVRYASAEESLTERLEVTIAGREAGFLAGVTVRHYDDVIGGRHTGEQPNTGYDEYDIDAKAVVNLDPQRVLTFAVQAARQDDVPRTHRTIFAREWHGSAVGTDLRHDFDQERDLVYAQYRSTEIGGIFDSMHLSVSLQRHYEDLHRVTSAGKKEYRQFEIVAPGFFARVGKETGLGMLTFGVEYTGDRAESDGFDRTAAGVRTDFARGEIAGKASVDLAGAFLQDEVTVAPDLELTLGARFTWERIDAEDVDPSGLGGPNLTDFTETYSAAVGSVRLLYHASPDVNLIAGVSQGFRAPNLDDTTAVRLVLSGQTDFPNPDLDPERSINFEAGTRVRCGAFQGQLFVFYTVLDDFIARVPAPSISPTAFTKGNFSEGWVKGVEASASYALDADWSARVDATWSIGNLDVLVGTETEERPISKMNPATAHVAVRWRKEGKGPWIEGAVLAVRRQDRLSPTDETDTQRIPPGGTPGFTVITIRGGIPLGERATATLAVENVADRDYRYHGSGTNEPGTNFIASLDVRF
jgi:hemoglobin/transferrin/lactoferrin receptor protein